ICAPRFTISLKRSTLIFSYPQAGRPITPSFGGAADVDRRPTLIVVDATETRRANFILRSYSFTPRALIWPESLSVCPTSRITMMSFLAFNMQVAEASVAMHEMPITTAAKEVALRQATAFPFFEYVCIGRTQLSARVVESHHRLSAAANRHRNDRTEISICCTVMSPVLALSVISLLRSDSVAF